MRIYGWGGGEEREFCDLFNFFSLPFERSSKKNIYEESIFVCEMTFFITSVLCDYHLLDIQFFAYS